MKNIPLFYKIFVPVLLVAIIAAGVGIVILNDILADYEAVQPKHVADTVFEKYYLSRNFEALAEKCTTESFETPETVAAYLHEKYGDAEMSCTSGSSANGLPTYIVKVGDYKISSFTLKESAEKNSRGWTQYEEGEFVLYYDTESVSVIAPEGYRVSVNSVELNDGFIAESEIPGDEDDLLPEGVNGVRYTRYTVNGLLGEPTVTAVSEDGENAEVSFSEEDEAYRAALIYSDELEQTHRDYVLRAAEEYSKYMENDSWWGNVSPYFDPDSEVYESARTSLTMFVIDHTGYRFDDVFVGEFYGYSEEVFSCRVSFTHVLEGRNSEYKDYFDSTLIFRLVDGKWRICGMINHA